MTKPKKVLVAVGLLAVGLFCTVMGARELNHSRKLAAHGQKTEGDVVDGYTRRRKASRNYHLTVNYKTADGQSVQKSFKVDKATYQRAENTRKVTVHYLPEDAQVSMAGDTVESKYTTLLGGLLMACGGLYTGFSRSEDSDDDSESTSTTSEQPADHTVAQQSSDDDQEDSRAA
jgi:hypothetical protein